MDNIHLRPCDRVIQIDSPDGTTTVYDKGTTTSIDANGHKKVEVKDVYDRLITANEYMDAALYATTTYEYNTIGNLIRLTDAKGNQTMMTYDSLGSNGYLGPSNDTGVKPKAPIKIGGE